MKNKFVFLVLGVLLLGSVLAVLPTGGVSYCCEKIKGVADGTGGAWCQNAPIGECDDAINPETGSKFKLAPTSCESTSFCKRGTCIDIENGKCTPNTPQRVCADGGGIWSEAKVADIPQCQLGCCSIGDQASFVTQTRCKKLSEIYGLSVDFSTAVTNEFECIQSAMSEKKGACVFEEEFLKNCKFTTKRECSEMEASAGETANVGFYEDYLCSAESLGTICGRTDKTTCVSGRDEVYFVDSCGNLANIYDASKKNDPTYWSEVVSKQESCGYGDDNTDSASCGSCDYFLGSTCRNYDRSQDRSRPLVGDNICRDLSCKYKGVEYSHGETWCADSAGSEDNLPGSRYFRMVCYDDEVTVEPCADFRQEVCKESSVNGFKTSGCVVNKWQDCLSQTTKSSCENTDKRDCVWEKGIKVAKTGEDSVSKKGACLPVFTPGLDFWSAEGDTESICSKGKFTCVVEYEKKLTGSKKCVKNCECLEDSWEDNMNKICSSLGDCGVKTNYVGVMGYIDKDKEIITSEKIEKNAK